jgi:glucosamine--fructose-6-phosphate aminotransferase (isomerizing)
MSELMAGSHTKHEIMSQPQVWMESLLRLQKLDGRKYPGLSAYDQVIFCGCGSTHFLAQWAARIAESVHGILCRAAPSSELLLYPDAWWHPGRRTLLVAISRSGETTETLQALKRFLSAGLGEAVAITCYPESALAVLAPNMIAVPEAQERSVAQTRSFSSMLLAAAWLIVRKTPPELEKALADSGHKMIESYQDTALRLATNNSVEKFFFLGSGPQYGLANEAMLKMKEMSLSCSEAFHFHEFRHGPMSMVDESSLVVGLIGDAVMESQHALLRELRRLGARTLGLQGDLQSAPIDVLNEAVLLGSDIPEVWRAPLYLPVLQMMAYERAIHKGLDPDRPTNLQSVVVLQDDNK